MNILIPHNWLLEHLQTTADPQTIQKIVSLSGPSVERIYEREGESVYDIEVTTNRVDSMSVRGMAREMAVILSRNQVPSQLKPLSMTKPQPTGEVLPLPTIKNNPQFCSRIICVVLDNVQHTSTPKWMSKQLRQIDQREHDSVVDITNYVTHTYGHPIHAFDYDKIMALGGVIRVVEASPGKTFVTLDGQSYQTKGGEIVFENEAGEIIDLPAIMGTANSSVDDSTNRVLLWVESLDAGKVRSASMRHAIRTVAAQLNEKRVDPALAEETLYKAVELYQSETNARVASEVFDEYHPSSTVLPVVTPLSQIEAYLGLSLTKEEILTILEHLGCEVTAQQEALVVTPPSFRPDITIAADVIEEIARIYGYHNLPSRLMPGIPPTNRPSDTNFNAEFAIKRTLAALGCQEVYTYSMVSAEVAVHSGFTVEDHLRIANPLSDDRVYLRRSLLPSLKELLHNQSIQKPLTVFEIANTYAPKDETQLPAESLRLSLASNQPYAHVRATVERALREFFIAITQVEQIQPRFASLIGQSAFGKQEILGNTSIDESGTVYVDLDWKTVLSLLSTYPNYQAIPKSAPTIEDLTFSLPKKVKQGDVLGTIRSVSPIIATVSLQGEYQHRCTYRVTYWDQDHTLTSDEVAPLRKMIVEAVVNNHQGSLVGELQ